MSCKCGERKRGYGEDGAGDRTHYVKFTPFVRSFFWPWKGAYKVEWIVLDKLKLDARCLVVLAICHRDKYVNKMHLWTGDGEH
jgi:hypothetical protein